jgi:hypothetical protein
MASQAPAPSMKAAYKGITAFVGLPGSGKSYSMVEQIVKDLKNGRQVYVNQGFEVHGCNTYRNFEEMFVVPPGSSIYVDEAPVYFNSRRWSEFPDALMYRFNQIRKDDLRLYWSAQHESRADVVLRQLTAQFWQCRAITSRIFIRALWAPEDFRKSAEKPLRRQMKFVKKRFFEMYDTNAKVAVPAGLLRRIAELRTDEDWITVEPGESLETLLARANEKALVVVPGGGATPDGGRGASGGPGAPSQGRSPTRIGAKRRPFTGGGPSGKADEGKSGREAVQ